MCNNESHDGNCDKNQKHYNIIPWHKSPACLTWVCNELYYHSDVSITNNVSCLGRLLKIILLDLYDFFLPGKMIVVKLLLAFRAKL